MSKPLYRTDVTDEEARRLSKPKLEELSKFVRRNSPAPAPLKPEPVEAPASHEKPTKKADTDLSADEWTYLCSIVEHPLSGMVARAKRLGLTNEKAKAVRNSLLEKNLVEVLSINLGEAVGGSVKLLELTTKGCEAVGGKSVAKRPQNVSAEHWFWQKQLHAYFAAQGKSAQIEMPRKGKRVDVGILDGTKLVAVEVVMNASNEVRNAKQDLEAGFHEVIAACKNSAVMNAVEQDFQNFLSSEERTRVSAKLLTSFEFVKDLVKLSRGVGTNKQRSS